MYKESYSALSTLLIDDGLSANQLAELEQLLKNDPQRVAELRQDLEFASLLEQASSQISEDDFMNGWATRVQASQSGDAFVESLIPRLREVDARQASEKIVPFPVRTAAAWGLAAAAAIALMAVVPAFLQQTGQSVATISSAEDVIWESPVDGSQIEWETGSSVLRGAPMRIREGIVRLELADGSQVAIEGPADVKFDSPSHGEMKHGKLLASGGKLTIETAEGDVKVENGTMGLRTVADGSIEAAIVSDQGQGFMGASSLFPRQKLVAQQGGIDFVPFDLTPYQSTLSVMSGVTRHSAAVSVSSPGHSLPTGVARDERGGVLVVLEDSFIRSQTPLPVDIVPGGTLTEEDATLDELSATEGVQSYLVQLANLEGKEDAADDDYINEFITFENRILGISATPSSMTSGDEVTGYDDEEFLLASADGSSLRGLEPGDSFMIRDDGRTLDLRMRVSQRQSLAQMRVFVAR